MSIPSDPVTNPSNENSRRADSVWFWTLMVLGTLIRLRAYFTGRSLWLDEAMLALNLRNRSFAGLAQPLDMDQIAPVGFLWVEKCVTLALGDSEWALRLMPLLCGIALLPIAYTALCRLSNPRLATAVLGILAFHPQLIYFSQEVKPYGLDAFAVVLVLAVAAGIDRESSSRFLWSALAAAAFLPWFSLTSVFALPGLLLAHVIAAVRQRSQRAAVNAVIVSIVFLLSCGLEYGLILRHQIGNAFMQSYWAATFSPDADGIAGFGPWALRTACVLLQDPGMIPTVLFLPIALTFPIGLYYWSRRSSPTICIIGSTILLGIVAAILRAYPPQGRLWLFAVPVLVIIIAGGIECLMDRLPVSWKGYEIALVTAALGMFFGSAAWTSLQRTIQPDHLRREDVRGMCEFVLAHRHSGDAIYISRAAGPAVLWYLGRPEFQSLREMPTTWGNPINGDITQAESEIARCGTASRLWLLFSHIDHASTDPHSDAQLLRDALRSHATSVILHKAVPNDFESEPAWTELFLRQP